MTTTRRRRTTEKGVERALDLLFGGLRFEVLRFSQARASMQSEGIADRLYRHGGLRLSFWFEVKAPAGTWRPAQRAFAESAHAAGELYVVGGCDEAYTILRALDLFNGTMLTPSGYLPGAARYREILGRVAVATHAYWRLTPAQRRDAAWVAFAAQRGLAP